MSKFVKIFSALVLMAGAIAFTSDTALAQRHRGGGGWHHGGGYYRGGGWGPGYGFGFGYPYYGGPSYYAPGPNCGWSRVRVWRGGGWVLRRSWRCW
jgi:hypothetical protein